MEPATETRKIAASSVPAHGEPNALTTHTESRLIRAPQAHIFDLVADVESYPDFLPMWSSARVVGRERDIYYTVQELGVGPIRETFRTRTELHRPVSIVVSSIDDMFRTFNIHWDFDPMGGGCRISIALTWEMRSRVLQRAIDLLLPETASAMVRAFEKRAHETLD